MVQDYAGRRTQCIYPVDPIPGVPGVVKSLSDSIVLSNLPVDEDILADLHEVVAGLANPDSIASDVMMR